MENREHISPLEIAYSDYLNFGPSRAIKSLEKDFKEILDRWDEFVISDIARLDVLISVLKELQKFGFQKSDVSAFSKLVGRFIPRIQQFIIKEFAGSRDSEVKLKFGEIIRLLSFQPNVAKVDFKNTPRDFLLGLRGPVAIAALSVLAGAGLHLASKSDENKPKIELKQPSPEDEQDIPRDTTIAVPEYVRDVEHPVYGNYSGKDGGPETWVIGDRESSNFLDNLKKEAAEKAEKLKVFKEEVARDFKAGKLSYENLFFTGEYLGGRATLAQTENAKKTAAEFDSDPDWFLNSSSMSPLEFFKKVTSVARSPNDKKDNRENNPYLSDVYNDPDGIANCKARTEAVVSKVQKHRPDLMKYLYIQKFGDHAQPVVFYEGKLYQLDSIMEQLTSDKDVMGTFFMKPEDFYVKKFLGGKNDYDSIREDSKKLLAGAGFDPNLVDKNNHVLDNRDNDSIDKDVFGDEGGPALSNHGSPEGPDNLQDVDVNYFEDYLDKLKEGAFGPNQVKSLKFKVSKQIDLRMIDELSKMHHLQDLSLTELNHYSDDNFIAVEDDKSPYYLMPGATNVYGVYKLNADLSVVLGDSGVKSLRLPDLKNISPKLILAVSNMRYLNELLLGSLDDVPDYFWDLMKDAKFLNTLVLGGVDLKRDFTHDKLGKLMNLPKFKYAVLSVSNVGEFTGGDSILKELVEWKKKGKAISFRGFSGITKLTQDLIDLIGVVQLSPNVDFSSINKENITAEQFFNLMVIADFRKVKFKFSSEVIIAYSGILLEQMPGKKTDRMIDRAMRDYNNIIEYKFNIPSVDNALYISELNKLGIDGEKLAKRFFPTQFK